MVCGTGMAPSVEEVLPILMLLNLALQNADIPKLAKSLSQYFPEPFSTELWLPQIG